MMIRVAQITVAIATMNRPDALERCLDALLRGHTLPAEIIVVDQSHDDATQPVVAQRQRDDVRIRYVRQGRRGLSASRNVALRGATCPVVAVTDDDCVADEGWVAAIERVFTQPDAPDAVTGRVLPLGPPMLGTYAVSSRTNATRRLFSGNVLPWLVGTGANVAVKRAWIERIGEYDERLGTGSSGGAGEDIDYLRRLLRAGARICYEPDVVIYHERQPKDRRLATRLSYGRGVGACCAIWLRQGDGYALRILAHWWLLRTQLMRAAVLRGHWAGMYEEVLVHVGTIRGLVYGARCAKRSERTRMVSNIVTSLLKIPQEKQQLLWRGLQQHPVLQRVRRFVRPAWLGTLRRTTPLDDRYGYGRGTPVDRYYIERFLADHQDLIRGRVLEVKNSGYTDQYGSSVVQRDVLDIDPSNPYATIVADLAAADTVPSNQFDCFVLTQTLQLIYDMRSAVVHAHRMLRPGGTLLVTVPAVSRIIPREGLHTDHWRLTVASCLALFGDVFGAEHVSVQAYGNVLTSVAFLMGMAHEELARHELEAHDPYFPVIVAVRAVKRPTSDR